MRTDLNALSLHDALPIFAASALRLAIGATSRTTFYSFTCPECGAAVRKPAGERIVELLDRKSTRRNSSHQISPYAVICLKKKKMERQDRKSTRLNSSHTV